MNMKRPKTQAQKDYDALVKQASPKSTVAGPMLRAFVTGGAVCLLGQALQDIGKHLMLLDKQDAGTFASVTLIALTALLTGLGVFDRIGKFAGAGTFVPITGFANAIASAAMEFRAEGAVMGLGAKMFTVAGPVLVYGISSAAMYGAAVWVMGLI